MSINDTAVSVIIPSYKPDEKLLSTVRDLKEAGFEDIIVVDDGGGEEYGKYFQEIRTVEGCTVLVHPENRGKGAALKTAFRWYLDNRNGRGVITVDGDGQHRPEDVVICGERLLRTDDVVLGVRDFSGGDIPKRSTFGNKFSCGVFRLFVGMKISDTQTGLRAIPARYLESMCSVKGDRYEYETNMLLHMKRKGIDFSEVKIKTIYIDENETSHFRPVRDSARIYLLILKHLFTSPFILFLGSSMICYLFDIILFIILDSVLSPVEALSGIANGVVLMILTYGLSRIASSLLNFCLNRLIFHKQGGSVIKTLIKYYFLVAFNLMVGSIAVYIISSLLMGMGPVVSFFDSLPGDFSATAVKSVVKIVVDAMLYFCSYNVQKHLIFKKKDGNE